MTDCDQNSSEYCEYFFCEGQIVVKILSDPVYVYVCIYYRSTIECVLFTTDRL